MERAQHGEGRLTPRQREVWRLVAKGHTNGEIAEELGISLDGAKWHVGELLTRFGASTREDLMQRWDEQHRPAARFGTALRALAALSWAKAGVGVAVGSAAVAGAVIVAGGAGSGSGAESAAVQATTGTPPSAGIPTVLAEQEALFRAETEANRLIIEHLLDYLADPNFRLNRTELISSKFVPAGGAYTTQDGTRQLVPTAVDTWVFSWLAEDERVANGAISGPGDVRVEVALADSTVLHVVAEQAQARRIGSGLWTFGHVSGFESVVPGELDRFQPAGEVFEITPSGGGPHGERLLMYVSRSGDICTHHEFGGAGGGAGCGPFMPDDRVIWVFGTGGGGAFIAGSEPPPPWLKVRLTPEVASIGVQSADRSEERFPAMDIPTEFGIPYRIAYFTSSKLEGEHWFVAYDADGNVLHRQGPWVPDGGSIPPYFLP